MIGWWWLTFPRPPPKSATQEYATTYRIEASIGAGGMGEVFRALDTRLGCKVAIKTSREAFSARFEREARVISSLNHPNICTLYDVGANYLVMELVEAHARQANQTRRCTARGKR